MERPNRRFYIESQDGGKLLYSTKNIIQAIFTADDCIGDLWEVPIGTTRMQIKNNFSSLNAKLLFSGRDPFCRQLPNKYQIHLMPSNRDEEGNPDGELVVLDLLNNKRYTLLEVETKELKYN